MKVKMEDVAKLANVNKATVSRALKGDSRISASTRERVWKAAKALGYQPDAVARGLSSNRTGLLGVVFVDLSQPWVGSFLSGLDRVASKQSYSLLVKCSGQGPSQKNVVARDLLSRNVDGIIRIAGAVPDLSFDGPLVAVGSENPRGFSVLIDVERGAQKLQKIAKGRVCEVRSGSAPFFRDIASFLKGPSLKTLPPLYVVDSSHDIPISGGGENVVLCGYPNVARLLKSYCLDWPAFELGAIAGRLSLNAIQEKGVRPEKVMVVPPLYSPEGDIVSL